MVAFNEVQLSHALKTMTCQEGKTRAVKLERKKTRSPLKHIISFIAQEKFSFEKEGRNNYTEPTETTGC